MPMKQSKTMPQLHYTRDDIQEQYTAVSGKEAASKLHQTGQHQSGSKKRQQRHHNHEFSSPHDSGDELTDSTADGENIRSSRSMKRKRQRRSRSASFFSGCFALPNTIRSRSFLSHLGFAANSSSSPIERRNSGGDRRRISESKTLVNLKQHTSTQPSPSSGGSSSATYNNNDPSSGLARKHVSFGSGQKGNQQQQQSTSTPDDGMIKSPANQDEPANEGAKNSNQDVIVNRGHHQAREQTQMAGTSKVPTIAGT